MIRVSYISLELGFSSLYEKIFFSWKRRLVLMNESFFLIIQRPGADSSPLLVVFLAWCWHQARPRCWVLGHIPLISCSLIFLVCPASVDSTHHKNLKCQAEIKEKVKKETWAAGALSSMNGAARLINEASPTPTSLQKKSITMTHETILIHVLQKPI